MLGLGTGSTVQFALERLGQRIREDGLRIRGVPTSEATAREATALGIALTDLQADPELDLTIDGADEVDRRKNLIKGGGAALTREKIVAAASREMVVIIGRSKLVERLGVDFLLPVEVLDFGLEPCRRRLAALGCETFVRQGPGAQLFTSDNGNRIVDCRFSQGIEDPLALEAAIDLIPGVLECGLFCGLAGRVIVGKEDGSVETL